MSITTLIFFFPLVALFVGALKRDRFEPESAVFAQQPWNYRDVMFVFALLTTLGLLELIPIIAALPEPSLSSLIFSAQAMATLSAVYGLLRWKYDCPFSVLGLRGRQSLYLVSWSLRIAFAIITALSLCGSLLVLVLFPLQDLMNLPGGPVPGTTLDTLRQHHPRALLVALIYYFDVVALMPFAEEVLCRGFLYTPLFRKFGAKGAMVASAVLFSSLHGPSLRALTALLVGLIYVYLYRRTESLIPSLTLHIAVNTTVLLTALLRDLRHAEALMLPLTVVSMLLFLLFRTMVRKAVPSDPAARLAWP